VTNPNVPSLAQPVTGQPLSQSYLKAQVYDPANFILGKPSATLLQSSAWNTPNNASPYTTAPWQSSGFDNWAGHSNTTNNTRYVIPVAGIYQLSGALTWAANATGVRAAEFMKNGTALGGSNLYMPASSSNFFTVSLPAYFVQCVVGDYLEIGGFQNSGAPLATVPGGCYFSITYVSQQ
jgi:hypothetical protein